MSLKIRLNIMITCLLVIMMVIGAWFMLQNARENVRAEISSTTSLTLHLLDREINTLSAKLVGVPDSTPFDLATLSHIRHLRIEFFDVSGRLIETNQFAKNDAQVRLSPKWFISLMTTTILKETRRDVFFAGRMIGRLIVTPDPMYEITETWDDTKDILALIFIFFIAVTSVVYIAIDSALKPISRILAALNDLEQGKLETRLPRFDLPELSSIALKFNHMAQTLEQSIKRNIGLSRQIINLEEVERKNLARDLHDEVGQSITAIHIDAQAILNYQEFNEVTIQNLRLSAKAILNVTKNMMDITHQILEKLRPDAIDKLGLKIAIQDIVSSWQSKLAGADCSLDISGELIGMPEDISITAYRVIQESLTNIARYANAGQINIGILQEQQTLVLMIEDDGIGFETPQMTTGFGLTGMRERIEGLGGELELDSAIGKGTRLVARLPLSL
jgi:two-component system, NarL family, sensor histidine kinase UhpB